MDPFAGLTVECRCHAFVLIHGGQTMFTVYVVMVQSIYVKGLMFLVQRTISILAGHLSAACWLCFLHVVSEVSYLAHQCFICKENILFFMCFVLHFGLLDCHSCSGYSEHSLLDH